MKNIAKPSKKEKYVHSLSIAVDKHELEQIVTLGHVRDGSLFVGMTGSGKE